MEDFSGYLAADELYDGPFCLLSVVDSKRQRRLAYEVLDHNPTHEDIRRFFRRVDAMLTPRGLAVAGVTTDGSPLYPEPLREIWPNAAHQVCEFHVLKEITKDVLRALAKLRKSLAKQIPPLPPGRPGTRKQKALARQVQSLRGQVTELFDHRQREIAEEVFDLLDRRKLSSAMILTSNRDIPEWGEVFADPVLASAAIDRMFEAADIVVFEGRSYRLKDRITLPSLKAEEIATKRREPAARRGGSQ